MSEEYINTTPTRPYIVRAIYEWIEDNQLTPYLMVDVTDDNVRVPMQYAQDGRIVLNIASRAVGKLQMGNEFIHFHARFAGVSEEIWVPLSSVIGIYAKENSQGMFFDPTEYDNYVPSIEEEQKTTPKANDGKRANTAGLKILK